MSAGPTRCYIIGGTTYYSSVTPEPPNATSIPDDYVVSDAVVEAMAKAIDKALNEDMKSNFYDHPDDCPTLARVAFHAFLAAIRQESERA